MQIVIEISEKIYEKALRGEFCVDEFRNSVLCGVVLSKGHGRFRIFFIKASQSCSMSGRFSPGAVRFHSEIVRLFG